MAKVYILQESSTRDGLNFDYFCVSFASLENLVRSVFNERMDNDEDIVIKDVVFCNGNIAVYYTDYDIERIWNNYSYIEVEAF